MFNKENMETEIEIDAAAERVWEVLTDLASYPQWNPMIRRASGELRVGSMLKVCFEPEGSRGYNFRSRLTVVDPGRELRWLGWPRLPGLFGFDHYWTMEETPDGKTRLRHGASAFGLAAPLLGKAMLRSSRKPFEAMNRAHKRRAEEGG
ncbi:MAG: SRPBCC domain-containing protein [Actinobacteria bacterium]|nr:SRPBCC domain-containing protein [Actinomycetota bacterium]MDI6831988.1 SRPBCC domain-containing protein [Actinomycetota bacterium]